MLCLVTDDFCTPASSVRAVKTDILGSRIDSFTFSSNLVIFALGRGSCLIVGILSALQRVFDIQSLVMVCSRS